MSKQRKDLESSRLRTREIGILKSVIRSHILTGEPVGSRTVSKGAGMDLSPATIRNIMADLEERGLLVQPHPSAGRVPTDKAYRFYVDRLMARPRVTPHDAHAIDEALEQTRGGIPELLEEASRQLSRFSKQVGVVLAPDFGQIVVEHVEFVRLAPRRVVAIVVGKSGLVHNRILDLDETVEQEELDRIGRHLSDWCRAKTLPEVRQFLRERISEDQATYDRLLTRTVDLGRKAADNRSTEPDVFVEGASNLVGSPDFADVERMRALLRTLEEKSRLVDLLGCVIEGKGAQVVIGSENPLTGLSDCSLVASSYGSAGRVTGTVGIVGPTRMEYARAVALVEHLAGVLTRLLSSSRR